MRCQIVLPLIAGLTLCAPSTRACDPIETARLDSTCVVMSYGAGRGVWFRDDLAEQLHETLVDYPRQRDRADAAEQLAALRDEQYRQVLVASHLLEQARKADAVQIEVFRGQAAYEHEQVEASKSVWRSPWLWAGPAAGLGAFLGCALAGGRTELCGLAAGGGTIAWVGTVLVL